jgi:hypothetical protein
VAAGGSGHREAEGGALRGTGRCVLRTYGCAHVAHSRQQQEFIKSMTGAETAKSLFQYRSLLTPV